MSEPTSRVFTAMVREEWRLHSHLFGGRRFAAFPLLVTVFVGATVSLLTLTGTGADTVLAGLHGLAFVFGLHTGSIGFVGRDALRNLLGDLTLLVFSARTLPLSRRRLLGLFVLKDVCYYAVLFLLPMALGVVPGLVGPVASGIGPAIVGPGAGGVGAVAAVASAVALLWGTLTASFVLGIAATLAGVGLWRRGSVGILGTLGVAVLLGFLVASGTNLLVLTPYGVFLGPTPSRVLAVVGVGAVLFGVGTLTFEVDDHRSARTAGQAIRAWRRALPGGDPLAAKTLLDVHRSSGGFAKVLFSAAVLLGVTVALVDLAGTITGVAPSVGVTFGTVLGLSAFTTYNWLTQFDDVETYLIHPLDTPAVFQAKFRAFVLLGPLVGLSFYALTVAWRGAAPLSAVTGGVLLVGVACYSFGLTVALAGLAPNEFLFDTVLFGTFAGAIAVPLVPVLVVGVALAPVSVSLLAGVCAYGVVLAVVGVGLFRRSLPKWRRHYRVS